MKSNHIGIENFVITNDIVGKGGMASIYLCQDSNFVAKKLSLYTIFPWVELYIMENPIFEHKYINQGVIKLKYEGTYIYQERALGTLKLLKDFSLTEAEIFMIMHQLVDGISYLHSTGFIHCDLKPSNVLIYRGLNAKRHYSGFTESLNSLPCEELLPTDLSHMFEVKITDFGLSTKKNWYHQAKIGSAKFRAPEANEEGWDERIDIWGLGHILYFLLTREELFSQQNYAQEIKDFEGISPSFSYPIPTKMKDLWLICKRMLEPDPDKRMPMSELVSYFNVPSYSSHSLGEEEFSKEIKRLTKIMCSVGQSKEGEKYRKQYRSIAKQMVQREKMPTNGQRCFDEIQVFTRISKKVIF